jgi:hypothetical protein
MKKFVFVARISLLALVSASGYALADGGCKNGGCANIGEILVVGDRYVEPIYFPSYAGCTSNCNGPGGGGGGGDGSSSSTPGLHNCAGIKAVRAFFACDSKAEESPTDVTKLDKYIPFSDRTQATWVPSALQFAQSLYSGTIYRNALPVAAASAINLCGNDKTCLDQALNFYGLQALPVAGVPPFTTAASAANWIRVNFASVLPSSGAVKLAEHYTYIEGCFLMNASYLRNGCTS